MLGTDFIKSISAFQKAKLSEHEKGNEDERENNE